jgi:hypothetical protein
MNGFQNPLFLLLQRRCDMSHQYWKGEHTSLVSTHLFDSCQKYPCVFMYYHTLPLLYWKTIIVSYWINGLLHPLEEVATLMLKLWLRSEDISEWFSTVISWATFYCSAAGPHTIINGKDVVNFASANYLGLTGHEKQIVRKFVPLFLYHLWLYFPQIRKCITKFF